jgi:hypothetical protein
MSQEEKTGGLNYAVAEYRALCKAQEERVDYNIYKGKDDWDYSYGPADVEQQVKRVVEHRVTVQEADEKMQVPKPPKKKEKVNGFDI